MWDGSNPLPHFKEEVFLGVGTVSWRVAYSRKFELILRLWILRRFFPAPEDRPAAYEDREGAQEHGT